MGISQRVRNLVRRAHFVSLGLHIAAFWGLMSAPSIELPKRSPSEYEQIMTARKEEKKIVLFRFRKELPAVIPRKTAPDETRQLRADVQASQSIVSSAPAPKRTQMVWTQAPELAPTTPLESPNLLAVTMPRPEPKTFVAPPDIVRPSAPVADVPLPPEINTGAMAAAEVPVPRLAKKFQAPEQQVKTVATVKQLEDTPQLAATDLAPANLPNIKVPARKFKAPEQPSRSPIGQTARLDSAPELASTALPGGSPVLSTKLPPKPFAAPRGGGGRSTAATPRLDAPPAAEPLNIAVVGLNPVEKAVSLPSASSPASFSSGPKVNPKGADAEPGARGLVVPDLFVRGTPPTRSRAEELIAQARATPTSHETIAAVIRQGEPVMTVRSYSMPNPTSGATRVATGPDPRMQGREVYMMAIQMPNLTSYSGSWLMWYSAKTAADVAAAPLAPPVAHRKIDPKYVATAAEERVQGKVRLACEIDASGHVSRVELLQGLDSRLDQTAADALSRWEFYPATRKGEPVAVDVVVEIPFQLAPLKSGKK